MRKFPGMLIQIITSALSNKSQTAKIPLDSFYLLLLLFYFWASSLINIDRFWGLVLSPWKRQKFHLYSFLLKNDASLTQQQTAASGSPTGSVLLLRIYCLLASKCQKDLIQIWDMDIILLQMEVSQIHLSQFIPDDSEIQQFPLTHNELNNYKQLFDKQSLQKKKIYLQAVQSNNNELVAKIKELDKKLNVEIDILSKKIVSPNKKRQLIPKIQQFESDQLKNKFKELQKIRKQVQLKRNGINSLDFLLSIRQKYKIQLSNLIKEIAIKKQEYTKFQKMKEKQTKKDKNIQNEVEKMGEFNMYYNQIQQLRKRVKQKNQQLKTKKDQFMKLYKQSRSNRSVVAKPQATQLIETGQDSELLSLKQQYMEMGKKLQNLKAKISSLHKNKVDNSQQQKVLQKLKLKLQNLSKVTNK